MKNVAINTCPKTLSFLPERSFYIICQIIVTPEAFKKGIYPQTHL